MLHVSSTVTQGIAVREFMNNISFTESPSSTGSNKLRLETKDIDFGTPGTEKKIYYVDITYSYAASSDSNPCIMVYANINNSKTSIPEAGMIDSEGTSGLGPTTTLSSIDTNWATIRLYFNQNQIPQKVKSISILLKAVSTVYNFKLNDISISYRALTR